MNASLKAHSSRVQYATSIFSPKLQPSCCSAIQKGHTMSRNPLIASLAGAIALGLGALSAQAASVPMSGAGIHTCRAQKLDPGHHHAHAGR